MIKRKLLLPLLILCVFMLVVIPSYASDEITWTGREPIRKQYTINIPKAKQTAKYSNSTITAECTGVKLEILDIQSYEGNEDYWQIKYKAEGILKAHSTSAPYDSDSIYFRINGTHLYPERTWFDDDDSYYQHKRTYYYEGTERTIVVNKKYYESDYNPMKLYIYCSTSVYAKDYGYDSVPSKARTEYKYTLNMNTSPYIANEIDRNYMNGKDSSSITVKGKVWDTEQDDITITAELGGITQSKFINVPNANAGSGYDYQFTFYLNQYPSDISEYLKVTAKDHYADINASAYIVYIDRVDPTVSTDDTFVLKGGKSFQVATSEASEIFLLKNNTTYNLYSDVTNAITNDNGIKIGDCTTKKVLTVPTIDGSYRLFAVDNGKNVSQPSTNVVQIDSQVPEVVDIQVENDQIVLIYDNLVSSITPGDSNYLLPRENVISSSVCVVADEDNVDYEFIFDDYETDLKYTDRFVFSSFDNSMFTNTNGIPNVVGQTASTKNTFHEVGKYILEYQAQDTPVNVAENRFDIYRKWGNKNNVELLVHRRPFANIAVSANLQGDTWNITNNTGSGYDLDHMDMPNLGIVDEQWEWKTRKGTFNSGKIPSTVPLFDADGKEEEYIVKYAVKDIEGAWSDPDTYIITTQILFKMDAKIKALDEKFNILSIPATEQIQVHDIVTECNRPIESIKVEIIDTNDVIITSSPKINFAQGVTGNKLGDTINWNPVTMTLPLSTIDGAYTVRLTVERQDKQVHTKSFNTEVYTPVWQDYSSNVLQVIAEPLKNIAETLLLSGDTSFEEQNEIQFVTSKYTSKVRVEIGDVSFYVYQDGTAGQDHNKTATYVKNDSYHQYKVSDIAVGVGTTQTTWKFNLSLVAGKPLNGDQKRDIRFYAYDTAGKFDTSGNKHGLNPQSLNVNLLDLKLENLRIVDITDIDFKDLFRKVNGQSNNYVIPFSEMALYQNKRREKIALGYQLDFKIDSVGLHQDADTIKIDIDYYVFNQETGALFLADMYVKEEDEYVKVDGSSKGTELKSIVLSKGSKLPYEYDLTKLIKNTWEFSLKVPRTAKFVKKDQLLPQLDYVAPGDSLLIVMTIVGNKNTGSVYNYTLKEEWAKQIPTYGYRLNTEKDLIGLGMNHGEVFWYDLKRTSLDDLYQNREW